MTIRSKAQLDQTFEHREVAWAAFQVDVVASHILTTTSSSSSFFILQINEKNFLDIRKKNDFLLAEL